VTQRQLDSAVAAATGETVASIRRRGFTLCFRAEREPENLALVVACPHCRRPVADPGRSRTGAPLLAECLDCNVYFDAVPSVVASSSF
jgi:hypothetical protein